MLIGYKRYIVDTVMQEVFDRRAKQLETTRQKVGKRDLLYWNYRYANGSYKARKCGLQPFLMTARRGKDMIRVYGTPDEVLTPNKLNFATARFKAWHQKELELKKLQVPAYKKWLKDNYLKAKDNPFSYWLINIAPKNGTLECKSKGIKTEGNSNILGEGSCQNS